MSKGFFVVADSFFDDDDDDDDDEDDDDDDVNELNDSEIASLEGILGIDPPFSLFPPTASRGSQERPSL